MSPAAEESLRLAERRLQAAQLASDVAALDELLGDAAVYTGPDGAQSTKADDLAVHRSGRQVLHRIEEQDLQVLVVGDTGVTWFLGVLSGEVDSAPFTTRLRYTRTWARDRHGWRIVAAHASFVGAD